MTPADDLPGANHGDRQSAHRGTGDQHGPDRHTVQQRDNEPHSVEQLILDGEHAARAILHDPEQMSAPAMLRAWAEVVECAVGLWHPLAGTTAPAPGEQRDPGDDVISRLDAMGTAFHRGLVRGDWPGAVGPIDERLLRIAENLSVAEEQLRRREQAGTSPSERLDHLGGLGSARAQLMHTLYVGAHGVAVALHRHDRDLRAAMSGKHRLPAGESFENTRRAQHRIAAFEQLAGSYLARTRLGRSHDAPVEPPADDRLAHALARWDVQAHRTAAATTSTADLMVISQTERAIATWSQLILRAAATTGAIDEAQHRERLSPAMDRAEAAWAGTADLWRDLTHRTQRRVAPELHQAAGEVRAALQDIAHDSMTVATPEVMAARTDLRIAAQTLQQSLSASADLACLIRDTVATAPVHGDARAISALLARRPDTQEIPADEDTAAAWAVNPWAAPTHAQMPLAQPAREALCVTADRVVDATATAMSAGAFLDPTPRAGPVEDSLGIGWELGRPMPRLDCRPSGHGLDR